MSERNDVTVKPAVSQPLHDYRSDGVGGALIAERPRPIVVVLGMHRSGTSLLSNALHVLGVDMADTTDHVSPKNPGGFWERPDLVAIHDEILAAIGRPIAQPTHVLPFPPAWWRNKEVQALKRKLIDYVREQLAGSSNPWGFKDPRTCRLLPLWREVFRELNLEPHYVVAVRTPDESSVSMSQKSNARRLSVATGELMWLSYNHDIVRQVLLKSPAVVVDYKEWFDDSASVARRLCDSLGIGRDLSPEEISECMSTIVHSEYRHQVAGGSEGMPIATMLYDAVSAGDEQSLRSHVRLADLFFKSVRPVVDDLGRVEAERDEFRDKAAEAASELQSGLAAAKAEASAAHDEFAKELERLSARLERERKRSRALLASAKEWRDTYAAEHGEPSGRLETAKRAAELQGLLDSALRRISALEDQRARLVSALEARDKALREISANAEDRSANADKQVFSWSTAELGAHEVIGGIDKVDGAGITGHVCIPDRPDVVPIVEARIDGSVALAQSCLASEAPEQAAAGTWQFFIPWSRLPPRSAGKQVTVAVAGVEKELGHAAVPADILSYIAPPAARAAELFGGTVAEAAEYQRWISECEAASDAELARRYREDPRPWPKINVVVFGAADPERLSATLESLKDQIFGDWEALCIDAGADAKVFDPRVRLVDASDLESVANEYGDEALFTFIEAGDVLAPTALLHLGDAALDTPEFSLIYSDEDQVDRSSHLRGRPYMKGAWSPDLALVQDYTCRLSMVRRASLAGRLPADAAGVYDVTLRAGLSGTGAVVHLPFVLYHRAKDNAARASDLAEVASSVISSTPEYAGAHLTEAEGRTRISWPIPQPPPSVSLIVPTRDRVELLRVAVDGFLHETDYKNVEVVIADNDSSEEATKAYLEKVSTHPRVRVIRCPGPFNFSRINNLAVRNARGELIGLMNNDLKVLDPNWLKEMVSHAVRPDVGIVGAKLLYDDGSIQHAGVTLGIALASHLYKSFPGHAEGRNGRLMHAQDVSAVTAACLLMRREVWDEVGGLDEKFPVAYNDVDLCLKVREAGYRIIWTPEARIYHLESRSRGRDVTPEKRERLNEDKARLIERWGEKLDSDPFHSPNFSASHVDSRLSFPPRVTPPWQPALAAE